MLQFHKRYQFDRGSVCLNLVQVWEELLKSNSEKMSYLLWLYTTVCCCFLEHWNLTTCLQYL